MSSGRITGHAEHIRRPGQTFWLSATNGLHRVSRYIDGKIPQLSPIARELRALLPECIAILGLLALIWGSTGIILWREHAHEFEVARGTIGALSKAYAESTARIVSEIDQTILSARTSYAQLGANFDISKWAASQVHRDQLRVQIALMDRNGNQVKSTRPESNLRSVNIVDRPHFKYHLDPAHDDLYISDPVIGRGSGEQTIQFTRKVFDSEGGFNGIVVLSLSCAELSGIYDTSGQNDAFVVLIGRGGLILAGGPPRPESVGTRLANLPATTAANGGSNSFMMGTPWDDARSLVSYRGLSRYSLGVLVGMPREQILQRYWQTVQHFAIVGTVASLIVICLGVFWIKQRHRAVTSARALSVTLTGVTQGIMMIDAAGAVSVLNLRAMELLRLPEMPSSTALAKPAMERLLRTARPPGSAPYEIPAPSRAGVEILETSTPDGLIIEVRVTSLEESSVVYTMTDITDQHKFQSRIRYLAHHDVLTDLPNRVLLEERMSDALRDAAASGHKVLVMFIDLDGFKGVNDTLGHMLGDRLLRHVAEVIGDTIGPADFVARLGGDEFVVVRTEVDDIEAGSELAHLLIDRISEATVIDEHELRVSTSIGISAFPRDGVDHHVLFKKADIALYRAKGEGRATYRIFESGMDERLHRRLLLEENLRDALEAGALQVHFQPQFESATMRLAGVEALVRWDHPEHGWVSPAVFIAVAEECGLIARLGAFVLEEACKEAASWHSDCFVAVNVSAIQLLDAGFVDLVTGVLERTGLPAHRLELELTESVMTDSGRQTIRALAALRDIGIGLALDDFGTGYSSLSNLLRFRFDKVKIDKTFVEQQDRDPEARAIVEAILAMGQHIGLKVTAEGVETEEQFHRLRDQGCLLIQGYFLGRPAPGWRLRELLQTEEDTVRA
jgi:diguanylate cyclase (GGDEF)-like protein